MTASSDKIQDTRTFARQVSQQSLDYVFDIGTSFAQILVVDLRVDRQQAIADNFRRPLSICVLSTM